MKPKVMGGLGAVLALALAAWAMVSPAYAKASPFAKATADTSAGRPAGPLVESPAATNGYENAAGYSNLNAAVVAALAKGVRGVRIPAGTTIIATGTISLPSSFAVIGDNHDTSRIVFETMRPGFYLNGVTGVVMRGFTLDGGRIKPNQESGLMGVVIEGASERVTLEDLVFVKMPTVAIWGASPTALVRVVRCRFRDGHNVAVKILDGANHWIIMNNEMNRFGIHLEGEGHLIIGNIFDNTHVAIQVSGMTRSLAAQNVVLRALNCGVYQWPGENDGNVYAYNNISHIANTNSAAWAETGFQTWSGGNNLVVGNLFSGILGYGINDSLNTLTLGNVCSDNVVHNARNPGVLVNYSDEAVIRRNRICHNVSIGADLGSDFAMKVRVKNGAHGCRLVNNVIRDNAIPGVWANLMSEGLIQGNRILNNGHRVDVWPPALHSTAGRAGLWLGWDPDRVGDNEFAFNRIIGNTIGDTRADPKQKTQWYGIVAGEPRTNVMILDPNDRWSFRSNTISWNDLRGNREAAFFWVSGMTEDAAGNYISGPTDRNQIFHHNATDEATAGVLDGGPALADAGPSFVVAGGSTMRLTAKHTRYPKGVDPASLQYAWRVEKDRGGGVIRGGNRGNALTIVGTNTPSPTVTFPKESSPALYGFVLRVTRPDPQDPKISEYTEDTVFVATYDDESCGLRLPVTFDGELSPSAEGPEGFRAIPITPTNGWQWSIRSDELAARLDGPNGGGVRLIPEGKIFGQMASVDMSAANPLAAGMSAGLALVNSTGAELPADLVKIRANIAAGILETGAELPTDGYFLGLHRGPGEAEASFKVIRFMGFKPAEFAGLKAGAGDMRILHQGRWDGKRLQLSIQRVGDDYTFLVNGAAVAKDTLTVLEEPCYDGPVPTVVALQVLASAGAAPAEVRFDNLAIDHAQTAVIEQP